MSAGPPERCVCGHPAFSWKTMMAHKSQCAAYQQQREEELAANASKHRQAPRLPLAMLVAEALRVRR